MLDIERCARRDVNALPGNLDVKALAAFDGVRQPAQLRREFRDAVVLLKITLALGCRLDAPLSLSLSRPRSLPSGQRLAS